ncbi:hypothetical protein [Candidatus Ichthyocystis hellenicum]|uniref:hypothetical protein n=1 Tax=Candidatus Ichthyocystis hellenicum TaxID=1561003 RepID=UPI001584AB19|nr:hypothetical protein [Candidatus Ichthyocystis hellenicum]
MTSVSFLHSEHYWLVAKGVVSLLKIVFFWRAAVCVSRGVNYGLRGDFVLLVNAALRLLLLIYQRIFFVEYEV